MAEIIESITIAQVAGVIAFIVALYGGVKYLKKEFRDGMTQMLKEQFEDIDRKLDNDNKKIKSLEEQNAFILKAISLLLQDDLAILEHLRTNNSTGKMAEQEHRVQEFLIER